MPAHRAKKTPRKRARTIEPAGALKRHYATACKIALALPGVELSTGYRTPCIKVQGRFLARLRTEAEGALAIRCDFLDRQILLQTAPETFFLTDHYRDYPMILVWLDKVRRDVLVDLIGRAWRMVAPPKLIKAAEALLAPQDAKSGG
ncbi:MAG TPA: MmcQ/YjbR family DNA-binding protein [Steroidobacteraceae bacterium]|nr:MmcQ/YjbR family DNA-binding protein [Steroidobacteraceae bacterium]